MHFAKVNTVLYMINLSEIILSMTNSNTAISVDTIIRYACLKCLDMFYSTSPAYKYTALAL